MGFAEAEQTDKAVSIASDISWTYSLDLVDSLKLAGSFPQSFLRTRSAAQGQKKKVMAQGEIVTVSLWRWRSGTQAKKRTIMRKCGRRRSRARCRPFWQRVKRCGQIWSDAKKDFSWIRSHHGPVFTASCPRLQASNGLQDLQQTLDAQLINESVGL